MANKKTIIGCNKFTDNSSISNSNWTTNLKKNITLQPGDNISVKTSFIDTRNKVAGYYQIPKDVVISMNYYFYYINRGGNQIRSQQLQDVSPNDPTLNNKQCLACDILSPGTNIRQNAQNEDLPFPQYGLDPTYTGNVYPPITDPNNVYSQYVSRNHPAYKSQTLPVTDDLTPTGKVPSNLCPLLESIYHCWSQINLTNVASKYVNKNGFTDVVAYANNPSGFNTTIDVASGDGLPYLLHYFIPENLNKNFVASPVNFSDMVVGQTYSILEVGLPWNGGYNTNWLNISSTLTTPTIGENFICESNVNTPYTFTDISKFDTVNSFIINNSIGYDFSKYGGEALPENTNDVINLSDVVSGKWYEFISDITPNFNDGTIITDYNTYCGMPENTKPTIGTQFIANANATTPLAINNNIIQNIAIGMNIQVINQGLVYWDLLGYNSNIPSNNDVDITNIEPNVPYRVISLGNKWGINNQFYQSDLGNNLNIVNNIVSFPNNQTQSPNTFDYTLDLQQLTPQFNGEYFVVIDNNNLPDSVWETIFDPVFYPTEAPAFQAGSILKLRAITTIPMPGVIPGSKIQWLSMMGIPPRTNITVTPMTNFNYDIWSLIGYTDNDTFTTTRKLTENDFIEFNWVGGITGGSFTFINPENMLRNYQLPVPFTFTKTLNTDSITDTTYQANLIPTDKIKEIVNYTFPLPAFKPNKQISNLIYNSSINATVVSTGQVGDENIQTNEYDNTAMNTGKMIPFTKTWKFKIKAGSYSPEYLAEIISRAMSQQKPKQNIKNGKIKISTPIVNINEQMIDKKTEIIQIGENLPTPPQWYNGYQGITGWSYNPISNQPTFNKVFNVQNTPANQAHPFLHQGGFPFTQPNNIDTWADLDTLNYNYIPNNQFVPKNKNILPSGDNLDNTTLPINPKYTENDFNYNAELTGDDTPFLYRPNAYGTRCSFDDTLMNIKLTYNDANLEYLNDIQQFGKIKDASIKNIEMSYKPLCNDAISDYFQQIQNSVFTEGESDNTNYSIRPVCSVPFTQLGVSLQGQSSANNYTSSLPSGNRNLSSPLVGSTQMSLTFNDENNNLFSFPYLHSGIYSKVDPTTTGTVESVAIYKNKQYIYPNPDTNPEPIVVDSIFQCQSQSGILLKNLTAEFVDGTESTFWQDLGFDVNAITAQNNKTTPDTDTFQIPYNDFLSKTTRGFSGTGNIYDNQSKSDLNEIAPISYYDSYTISGWVGQPIYQNNQGGLGYNWYYKNNFIKYDSPLYFSVEKTISVDASRTFTNLNDTGHILLSIEGFNGQLINTETVLNIKSIISNYYSSANFITNPDIESIVYEHVGEPMEINSLKIVLIDPFTNQEIENIGPNSSIYLEITQALNFQNGKEKK